MKLKPILIIFAFVIVSAGFYALLYFTNRSSLTNTSGEITAGMKLGTVHEIKVGDSKVEIGSGNQSKMRPIVTFSHGNNVSLGISFPVDNKINPQAENNKITWNNKDRDVYFKSSTSGIPKYELDILLKQRPPTNTFTYNLDTNNLEFAKNDKDGAYSAYKKGYQNETGIYNKGELFRIERPKITDAKGKETWGKLSIDTLKNKLSVTVENNWLAAANYPVTVDPTIILNDTNHVLITKVDRFRWKLAVEYEIRNDEGKLLGSDVVITETTPRETKGQIFGFFKDYLTKRDAIWLLAQGNYTLYEMSNDRLASPNFQKPDNADDVNDQYTSQRQARKQILDSLKKEDYPTYSLTLEQADKLQNPSNPAFTLANEKSGAGTEILRPDGTGDAAIDSAYWASVDEVSPDDAASYYFVDAGDTLYGYHTLQNTSLSTETLDSIDVTYRESSWDEGDDSGYSGFAYGGVRRAGSNSLSGVAASAVWTTHTNSSVSRPGGGSWIISDLNGLQAASELVSEGDGYSYFGVVALTQIYVTVNYTAGAPTSTPTPTPIPTPTSAAPTITTPTKTPIHGSDATLGGNVTSDGGAAVTGRGVCIGASSNPALGGTCFSTSGTTGVFTVSATSLTQNTLYHYRAYTTNSVGTSYTTDDTFTTLALNNYLITVVSPQTAGVCVTGTNTVTARDSTNAIITTDSSIVDMTSTGTGVTFYTTSGCSSSTTQYTLSSGVTNIYYKTNVAQSFTITATKASSSETGISGSITVNSTVPTITTPTQTSITSSGATLGGDVALDGGTTITGRGVCLATSIYPTLSDTCFSASGTTGVFTVSATSLTPDTLYYYRAYATNSVGTSYTSDDIFTSLVVATPTPTPTNTSGNSTPTPTPTSTTQSSPLSVCSDIAPAKAPDLYSAATQGSDSVLLSFTPSDSSSSKYILEYGTKSGEYSYGVQDMGVSSSGNMTFLVKSLALNTTYYFRVKGANGCATGPWSNEISAQTKGLVSFNQLNITQSELKPNEKTPVAQTCKTHTVTSSDNLWDLASKLLGSGSKYKDIITQNKNTYPSLETSNNLKVGWKLKVNCSNQTTTETPKTPVQRGYNIKITVVDTHKKPVEGATVTIHSTPQTVKTDKNGIAEFKHVEAGDHKVLISYNGFEGQQSVNLSGNAKKFDLNITVSPRPISLSLLAYVIIGSLVLVILALIFLVVFLVKEKRSKKSQR